MTSFRFHTATKFKKLSLADETVLNWIFMVAHLAKFTLKYHCIIYLKPKNFVVYKSDFNKVLI